MLSRLKKQAAQLQDKAAQLQDTVSSNLAKEQCARCKKVQFTVQLSLCPCCFQRVCSKCSENISVLEPSVLDPRWAGHKNVGVGAWKALTLTVCADPCATECAAANVKKFRSEMGETFYWNTMSLLHDGRCCFYGRPDAAVTATGAGATARRLAPLAKKALSLTGYSALVSYATVVVEAGSVAALVLSPQARALCDRIMPILRRHCFQTTALQQDQTDNDDEKDDKDEKDEKDDDGKDASEKIDTFDVEKRDEKSDVDDGEAPVKKRVPAWVQNSYDRTMQNLGRQGGDAKRYTTEASELALRLYYLGCATAVDRLVKGRANAGEAPEASDEVLDAAGDASNLGAAQWLYASQKLRMPHDGPDWGAWYASRLAERDGFKLLACVGASRSESELAVPTRPPTPFPAWCLVADPKRKLAILALRGSVTHSDWLVNSDVDPVFVFPGLRGHGGLAKAARAVLDDCGARKCLVALGKAGYTLRTVGHSMGAGVAALACAMLRREDSLEVTCVAYAAPACVDENFAETLDAFVLSVVHRDDLIPRLSDTNCAKLAKELVDDDNNYRARYEADKDSIKKHITTLGKVMPMQHKDGDDRDLAEAKHQHPEQITSDLEEENKAQTTTTTTTVIREKTTPRSSSTTTTSSSTSEEKLPRLVPPGRILYLKSRDATYDAVAGGFEAFEADIGHIIVTPRAVDDHMMPAHVGALRAARWARGRLPQRAKPPVFRRGLDAKGQFLPCYCCGSDTTWTSWTSGSDAARAAATHHCRGCGNVVCAFCAPAGDEIAGDGIGQTLRLPDLRLSLPSFGYFEPVRLCRPCSYAAYNL